MREFGIEHIATEVDQVASPVQTRRLSSRLIRRPLSALAAIYVIVVISVAVFAPWVAPHDPNRSDLDAVYQSPGRDYFLGTDALGRDILSRLVFGARTSMLAAAEAVGVSLAIGLVPGLIAGYLGGRVDGLLTRLNDAIQSIPGLILALAIVAALGPGLTNGMLAVGIVLSPRIFRVVRAATLGVRHETFIEASEALGCTRMRIIAVHVLPNVLSPLFVVVAVSIGTAVLAEASLSFLGLGARPPTASWGGMLAAASQRMDLKYLLYSPGLVLVLTIAAFIILGDRASDVIGSRRGSERA